MARPSRGVRAARSGRVAAVVSCLFLFKQMQSNRKRCRFCSTKHLSSSSVLVCAVQGSPASERPVNSNMFGHQQIHMKDVLLLCFEAWRLLPPCTLTSLILQHLHLYHLFRSWPKMTQLLLIAPHVS